MHLRLFTHQAAVGAISTTTTTASSTCTTTTTSVVVTATATITQQANDEQHLEPESIDLSEDHDAIEADEISSCMHNNNIIAQESVSQPDTAVHVSPLRISVKQAAESHPGRLLSSFLKTSRQRTKRLDVDEQAALLEKALSELPAVPMATDAAMPPILDEVDVVDLLGQFTDQITLVPADVLDPIIYGLGDGLAPDVAEESEDDIIYPQSAQGSVIGAAVSIEFISQIKGCYICHSLCSSLI